MGQFFLYRGYPSVDSLHTNATQRSSCLDRCESHSKCASSDSSTALPPHFQFSFEQVPTRDMQTRVNYAPLSLIVSPFTHPAALSADVQGAPPHCFDCGAWFCSRFRSVTGGFVCPMCGAELHGIAADESPHVEPAMEFILEPSCEPIPLVFAIDFSEHSIARGVFAGALEGIVRAASTLDPARPVSVLLFDRAMVGFLQLKSILHGHIPPLLCAIDGDADALPLDSCTVPASAIASGADFLLAAARDWVELSYPSHSDEVLCEQALRLISETFNDA